MAFINQEPALAPKLLMIISTMYISTPLPSGLTGSTSNRQTGCHIIHYINLHLKEDLTRIQFAANLLRYHHYTITQAAREVGIPDVPYFTRLFKRTMGETPSQYARKKAIES